MEEKIININGIKTFTRIAGQGNPFLILHGWGASADSWEDFQEKLSKDFQVIVLDLPGFGKSDLPPRAWAVQDYVQLVLDFVKNLGIEKFYLLGHSFGGRVAIKLVAQYPQKIEKLILVDAAGIKVKKGPVRKLLGWIASFLSIFKIVPGFKIGRRIFYRFVLRKTDYLKVQGIMKEVFKKIIEEDLTPYLEKIEISTLIAWGKEDKMTPVKDGHLIHQKIKNSELKLFDCGHNPHFERENLLVKTILDFL